MGNRGWAGVLAVGFLGCVAAGPEEPGERSAVSIPLDLATNYASAGASTSEKNFSDVFEPEIAAAIHAYGLAPGSLELQLFEIEQTRHDVDPGRDVVLLWMAGIDYLIGETNAALPPQRMVAAMDRLYQVGFRRFVVPNVTRLAATPTIASIPGLPVYFDVLVGAHNLLLGPALAGFALTHPGVTVVPVDAHAVSLALADDPRFANRSESCLDVGLPAGADCSTWLYLDAIHYNTLAQASLAQAAAAGLAALDPRPVRRLVTLGDSMNDVGANFDLTERALGAGWPRAPFYWEGRFGNGPIPADHLADLLGVPRATFFPQPFVGSLAAAPVAGGVLAGSLAVDGEVMIPGALGAAPSGLAVLELGEVTCLYLPRKGKLARFACSQGAQTNQRVRVGEVALTAIGTGLATLSVPILHYE